MMKQSFGDNLAGYAAFGRRKSGASSLCYGTARNIFAHFFLKSLKTISAS